MDVALALVDSTWALSLQFIPIMYLGFLTYGAFLARDGDLFQAVIGSQRSFTIHYGKDLFPGILLGGIPVMFFPGLEGLAIGGIVAAAWIAYVFQKHQPLLDEEEHLSGWKRVTRDGWVIVPLLALLSILLSDPLMKSAVALIFYGAVFWKI